MGILEKLLFEQFPKMPAAVRVVVYLLFVTVFVYLLLVPRFIDGQLVVSDPETGGVLPYRGADLQLQVDGRSYKFRSNEDGFFSIPVIGRMPQGVELQVLHVDTSQWFPVEISVGEMWTNVLGARGHRIEVLAEKPFIRLGHARAVSLIGGALNGLVPPAYAQSLELPRTARVTQARLGDLERAAIHSEVQQAYARVSGKRMQSVTSDSPLSGAARGLTYVQRIQLVTALEARLALKIPDDHWQQMRTLGQLVDYLEKRKQLDKALPPQSQSHERSWAQIQQSFPPDARPVYKE